MLDTSLFHSCVWKWFPGLVVPWYSQRLRLDCSSLDLPSCPSCKQEWCCVPVFMNLSNSWELLKIIESGLAMVSASSLSSCGYNLSDPMDLHMSSLLKCSFAWSSCRRVSTPWSRFFLWSQKLEIPKGLSYGERLSWRGFWVPWVFCVIFHQVPWPIQQWAEWAGWINTPVFCDGV